MTRVGKKGPGEKGPGTEPPCLEDREFAAVWDGLELPPPEPAPEGYVDRVVAHCRAVEVGPPPLSAWTRAAAWAALLVGAWLGHELGGGTASVPPQDATVKTVWIELSERSMELDPATSPALGPTVPSLAEVYWAMDTSWVDRSSMEDVPLIDEVEAQRGETGR